MFSGSLTRAISVANCVGVFCSSELCGRTALRKAVWSFHIGGYQVCEKWLKDRRGRKLSKDDIAHYHKIVVALHETNRLMREIDEAIEKHGGGWLGAFVARSAAARAPLR